MPKNERRAHPSARTLMLVIVTSLLTGCGSEYVLRGRVVSGPYAEARFVTVDDADLARTGLAGARIQVYRDPDKPNIRVVAAGRSDRNGDVSIPLDAFGAGWMEERWLIEVVSPGHETLETMVTLPRARDDRRMLVVLRKGYTVIPDGPENLWEEYKTYR